MTFTPSTLGNAFTHTHTYLQLLGQPLAQTIKHSTCNALHFPETLKPVFRSDSTVSVMELIASAHAFVRQDVGFFFVGLPLPPPGASGQALYGMTRGTGH